jgi:hypothetical protein
MYCNTIAGRTYNDLTQYPVFPWVSLQVSSRTPLFLDLTLCSPCAATGAGGLRVGHDRSQ